MKKQNFIRIIALFIVFFSFVSVVSAEKTKSVAKSENTELMLNEVIEFVREKDSASIHTLNNVPVNMFTFYNGQKIVVAKDRSFLILSLEESGKFMLDFNTDGFVDRTVINKDKTENEGSKFLSNVLYASQSMNELIEDADIVSMLISEEIYVTHINGEGNEVKFISISDGKYGTFRGDDASDVANVTQTRYIQELAEIYQETGR